MSHIGGVPWSLQEQNEMENAPLTFRNALDVTDTRLINKMPKNTIAQFDVLFAFANEESKRKINWWQNKNKNENKTRSCEAIGFSSEINEKELNEGIR